MRRPGRHCSPSSGQMMDGTHLMFLDTRCHRFYAAFTPCDSGRFILGRQHRSMNMGLGYTLARHYDRPPSLLESKPGWRMRWDPFDASFLCPPIRSCITSNPCKTTTSSFSLRKLSSDIASPQNSFFFKVPMWVKNQNRGCVIHYNIMASHGTMEPEDDEEEETVDVEGDTYDNFQWSSPPRVPPMRILEVENHSAFHKEEANDQITDKDEESSLYGASVQYTETEVTNSEANHQPQTSAGSQDERTPSSICFSKVDEFYSQLLRTGTGQYRLPEVTKSFPQLNRVSGWVFPIRIQPLNQL
ncbi:unnamed protein product [Nesidiocoris tenuis]|uniref:Uncharacterized protein n=1 Tax=Nesidiocoris tenuis TaxID=355587 RepID=A0A6H5HD84_9HEMI|nr:unnamed protein product [Nesidiocoris tenuis]